MQRMNDIQLLEKAAALAAKEPKQYLMLLEILMEHYATIHANHEFKQKEALERLSQLNMEQIQLIAVKKAG